MKYGKVIEGIFESRPNRFIAYVKVGEETVRVHVKNTGRCQELLVPGATVYLECFDDVKRSTAYDLIAVQKGERLINMDSQAPNHVVGEWLAGENYFTDVKRIKPEMVYGDSRIDFYVETQDERNILLEVKGVTLEEQGNVSFPDAPTERGVKHIKELTKAVMEGYEAYILFVIQMNPVYAFMPNERIHAEFARELQQAVKSGVKILAYDCDVLPNELKLRNPVPVFLSSLHYGMFPLINWYEDGHRELAWRSDPTPYHVWLSEIMLQQTRVEAVKGYYDRFLHALPSIDSLAKAPEDQLLRLWEGLGYYNRVRNLQKAAEIIVKQYDGKMPADFEQIKALPGIGSYTAGAISSIAFGLPYPAVDGNVLRILSRLRADARDIADGKVKQSIEEELLQIMPGEDSGILNQAMMELGATVCVPNGVPHCEECPWMEICIAHRYHEEVKFPVKAPKKERTIDKLTVLIIKQGAKTYLHKREAKGLLAGLYEFPNLEGHLKRDAIGAWLVQHGMLHYKMHKLPGAKHIFTHKEWHMIGYLIELEEDVMMEPALNYIPVTLQEREQGYAIPSAFSAYVKYL